MAALNQHPGLLTTPNLRTFFHESVKDALDNQKVSAEEATICYVVNLLTEFSRSERLFDYTNDGFMLRPLAELYAISLESTSELERKRVLQRLGDVALFVSGLFAGILSRRLVDVDYYIAMGGSAYAYLYETSEQRIRDQAFSPIFRELSTQFARFVDVLNEVGENAPGASDGNILRLYELWVKTGSPRIERKLRELGITPAPFGRAN